MPIFNYSEVKFYGETGKHIIGLKKNCGGGLLYIYFKYFLDICGHEMRAKKINSKMNMSWIIIYSNNYMPPCNRNKIKSMSAYDRIYF